MAVREGDRICLELGAETLLKNKRAEWAWRACLVLQDQPTLRLDGRKLPLMLRVAHALGDRTIVQEIFAEVVRMPFPGGVQTVAWAQALEESGETALARELYLSALDRLDATNGMQPDLSAAWTRYLIQQREFEAAESYLMHALWTQPNEAPKVLFDLYAAWGRLPDLRAELRKFHLPGGIEKEVLFLAAQALGIPSPATLVPSS
jgi:tetratricopeptide (TPR) repeat protein